MTLETRVSVGRDGEKLCSALASLAPVHAIRASVLDARLGMHVLAALRAIPPSGIRAWAEVTA